jgi:hypothetical protein
MVPVSWNVVVIADGDLLARGQIVAGIVEEEETEPPAPAVEEGDELGELGTVRRERAAGQVAQSGMVELELVARRRIPAGAHLGPRGGGLDGGRPDRRFARHPVASGKAGQHLAIGIERGQRRGADDAAGRIRIERRSSCDCNERPPLDSAAQPK